MPYNDDDIDTLVSEYYNEFGLKHKIDILADSDPSTWASNTEIRKEITERVLAQKKIFEDYFVIKKGKVLDLGCGFGRQALILARMGYEVTACDISEVWINIGRELAKRENLAINFIPMNAKRLQLPDHSFDYVVILDMIEHLPKTKRKQCINEAARTLKEGGVIFVSIPRVQRVMDTIKFYYKHPKNFFPAVVNFGYNKILSLMGKKKDEELRITEEHPFPLPPAKEITKYLADNFQILELRRTSKTFFFVAVNYIHQER